MNHGHPLKCDLYERDQAIVKTPQLSRGTSTKETTENVLCTNSTLSSSSSRSPSCIRSGSYEFGRSVISETTHFFNQNVRENQTKPTSSPFAHLGLWNKNIGEPSTGCENYLEKNETRQKSSWSKCYDCKGNIEVVSSCDYPHSSVNSTPYCPSRKKGLLESSNVGQKRCASTDTNPSLHKKISLNLYDKLQSPGEDVQNGPSGISVKRLSNLSEKPLPSSISYGSRFKELSTNKLHSFLSESVSPFSRGTAFQQIGSSKDEPLLPVSEMLLTNTNTPFGKKDLSTDKESSARSETLNPKGRGISGLGTDTSSGILTDKPHLGSRSTPSRSTGSSSRFFHLGSAKMITSLKTPSSVTVRRNGQVTTCLEGMKTCGSTSTMGHPIINLQTEEEDIAITHVRSVPSNNNTAESDKLDISNDAQVYMSLMWHGGKLGVAYYDMDTTQMFMMLDAFENDEFRLLERVLKQVRPSQVILSTKQEERLLKRIKSFYGLNEDNAGNGRLQFLPSIDFSLNICKRRILSLDLPSMPSHFTVAEQTLYISSLVPFENTCMVQAVGGLIKYLERKRIGVQLEEQSVRVPILELKIFSLENQLIMDDTAFSALQIFQKEFHPSAYKAGTSSSVREGLSLFGKSKQNNRHAL